MKILGFITVRTMSDRLPQKTLLSIKNQRIIEHIIDRAKLIRGLDDVVVCTSDQSEDDILESIAKEKGVPYFRGSLEDKLERFQGAVNKFGADYFLVIDADDLFFDPEIYELAIEQIKKDPCDIIKSPDGLALGAFTFCINASALKQVVESKNTGDTEMYEAFFLKEGRFDVKDLAVIDPIFFNDRVRLTLDYQEDLDFFRRVFDEFPITINNIPLREILKFLNQKPKIAKINLFRHRDYLAKREIMRAKTEV